MAAVLCAVAAVYWPVLAAGFIWDDNITMHDAASLRHGDEWRQLLASGIAGWINYFRPLAVALFALEVRTFDVAPMPMHLVSLSLHLANTALVAALAKRVATVSRPSTIIAALAFGLHPALVEPVTWISSQSDLIVTLLTLLALLGNASIAHSLARCGSVCVCFFLAACAKESAIALPLLILVFDVMSARSGGELRPECIVASLWRRQRVVYSGLLATGIVYLLLRHAALAYIVTPIRTESLFSFPRVQKVCQAYLEYWRLGLWPMSGTGPIHIVPDSSFVTATAQSILVDVSALSIFAIGLYRFARDRSFGVIIVAATVALSPVLHIVPIGFAESLYHERYATTAIAVVCVLLPTELARFFAKVRLPAVRVCSYIVIAAWLAFAVANIRATIPLWSDEARLWTWALKQDPGSVFAEDHLLSVYLERNDHKRAREVADALSAQDPHCPNCWLNIANLGLSERDLPAASVALDKLRVDASLAYDPRLMHGFILASAQMLDAQGNFAEAAAAYSDAITTDPLDPSAHMERALFLAHRGDVGEARKEAELALALYAPDMREEQSRAFEHALSSSGRETP